MSNYSNDSSVTASTYDSVSPRSQGSQEILSQQVLDDFVENGGPHLILNSNSNETEQDETPENLVNQETSKSSRQENSDYNEAEKIIVRPRSRGTPFQDTIVRTNSGSIINRILTLNSSVRSLLTGEEVLEAMDDYRPVKEEILTKFSKPKNDDIFSNVFLEKQKVYKDLVIPQKIKLELESDAESDSSDDETKRTAASNQLLNQQQIEEEDIPIYIILLNHIKNALKYLFSIRILLASWVCILLLIVGASIFLVLQKTMKDFSWDRNLRLHTSALEEAKFKIVSESNLQFSTSKQLHSSLISVYDSSSMFSGNNIEISERFTNYVAKYIDTTVSSPLEMIFYCTKSGSTIENCVAFQKRDNILYSYIKPSGSSTVAVYSMLKNSSNLYSVDSPSTSINENDILLGSYSDLTGDSQLLVGTISNYVSTSKQLQANIFTETGAFFGVYTSFSEGVISISTSEELQITNVFLTNPSSTTSYFRSGSVPNSLKSSVSELTSISPSLVNKIPEGIESKYSFTYLNLGSQDFVLAIQSNLTYYESLFLQSILNTIIVSICIAIGASIICSLFTTELILLPLSSIRDQMKSVSEMKLHTTEKTMVYFHEYEYVINTMRKMKRALVSFGKFVPIEVIENMIREGKEAQAGVKEVSITIFFCDIVDFTKMTETIAPKVLAETLTITFECLTSVIATCSGTIDKFIGDAILAFWNAPKYIKEHPVKGVRAAVWCQQRLKKLKEQFIALGVSPIKIRIGMDFGECLVGMIGSQERLNYTILGNHVNTASRLEGVNKYYKTEIIISHYLYEKVREYFVCRPVDVCTVQGQKTPLILYEVIGEQNEVDDKMKELCYNYKIGFHYYLRGEFKLAHERFSLYRKAFPNDHTTKMIVDKCEKFLNIRPKACSEIITTTSK